MIGFLAAPRSHGDDVVTVSTIETHHARVFLAGSDCYKMKKSGATRRAGYTLDDRKRLCDEEYRLNRQLAPDTYTGVVPLVVDDRGNLSIGGHGRVVEWLVRMRRLPEACLMHRAMERGAVSHEDVRRIVRTLVDFYRRAVPCRPGGTDYPARLRVEIAETCQALGNPDFGLDASSVESCLGSMNAFLEARAAWFEDRDSAGLVREVHGDLRPEHICLLPDRVEIIDRLEFDADLRCLDCAEELAYLCMECRHLGQGWFEPACIEAYQALSGDRVPAELWSFYGIRRACVRAMLCAWHSRDDDQPERWLARARRYLTLAGDYVAAMAGGSSA